VDLRAEESRHIQIEGCYNLRDVGGYAARDGRRIRWRTLLRSDSLHRLPPASWRALRDQGVRTIIDLRRPGEIGRAGYRVDEELGLRYRHMPLFDDQAYLVIDQPARDLDEMYRLFLDNCAAQFGAILRAIAATGGAAALVHCAVGKDRTGLTIALALGAAGVPAETIAQDYALSSALLAPLYEEFRDFERRRGGDMARLERILESRHETMLRALAYLEAGYGGIQGYLQHAGLIEAELEGLRGVLLESEEQ
jgi:protein-tyrosine phosphatase